MSIRVNRLGRALSGLTVEQRFDAVLNAYREDRPPSWSIATGLAAKDAERWNRLVGLLGATHTQLGWYVSYVEATVTQVELRFGLLLGFQLAHLHEEEKLFDLALDPEAEDERERCRTRTADLDRKLDLLAAVIAGQLQERWMEVRLAEVAADALAEECSGRDIVHPDTKATLADCKERMLGVKASLAEWIEVALVEPEDGQVEILLDLLEQEAER